MSNALASAATAATYNIVLQFCLRLVTFLLNAFILRYMSKELLGVVNVRLLLLYNTVVFLSREAFRRACMNKETADKDWKPIINLLWCIFPISIGCGVIFGYLWVVYLEKPDESVVENYKVAVIFYVVGSVIEILSEPLYITAQVILYVRLKVVIEAAAIAIRSIFTVVVVLLWPQFGVLNFCIAQLCFSLTISCGYYIYFLYAVNKKDRDPNLPFLSMWDFFPSITGVKPIFSDGLRKLVWSFSMHSILKQIINEGERYVMTIFHVIPLGEQGVFDVVTNLGSLAGRFIFLPIEDSGYLFFAHTLDRGKPAVEQDKGPLKLSTDVLEGLLKMVTWIGLTILCFGYSYSFLLLDFYGGSVLSNGPGPALLRWFCLYVVLMAINGVTECFSAATMGNSELNKFNQRVFVSSVLYLASLVFLCARLGSVGLILGNCLHYFARISFSVYHISRFYKNTTYQPLLGALPKLPVIVTFVLCWLLTAISETVLCCHKGLIYDLVHIGFGGMCLLSLLAVTYISEHKVIGFIREQYQAHKSKSKQL